MPLELTERQRRIREDLAAELDGEVRVGAIDRMLYSSDAGLYQILPEAIAYPRSHADVETLVRYCDENEIVLHARGGGSGVAGGCLGEGFVVDFSRLMRRVIDVDVEARTCRVEAGVVRDALNRSLKVHGLYFAPDPATSPVTTIGGMAAVDAAGSHRLRFGSTRSHVLAMRTVFADGESLEATASTDPRSLPEADPNRRRLTQLRSLLGRSHATIAAASAGRPASAAGYQLSDVLREDGTLHLPRLLVGSEGTLGLSTELTLSLQPLAEARVATLVVFSRVEAAIEASLAIAEEEPDACDLLDRRLLGVARQVSPRFETIIPTDAECGLVIDVIGERSDETTDRMRRIRRAIQDCHPSARFVFTSSDATEARLLWSLPSRVLPILTRLSGGVRPLPIVEDIVLPTDRLIDFLPRARRVFQRYDTTCSLQSHVLTGQLHLRPMLPIPRDSESRLRLESIARDLYEVVFDLNGTISGEHGDGLSRTAFLRSRFGPAYRVFREVKDLFDPLARLNRGKIISDEPHLTIQHLRTSPDLDAKVELELVWPQADDRTDGVLKSGFAAEIDRCTGCGDCRRSDRTTRMCPVLDLDRIEHNSPRSKAIALRGVLDGSLPPNAIETVAMKSLAERCFNCRQCQLDCPTHVDVPHLMIEAKAAAFRQRGLSRPDWLLSRAHTFGRLVGPLAPAVNAALGNRPARWLLEKAFGLARQRKLPKLVRRPFLKRLKSERIESNADVVWGDVIYFVDHYANFHDPDLAEATVAVLTHNGWNVVVPRAQQPSAMAMITAGDLEAARQIATENVQVLHPWADRGTPIVCSEPTAALAITDDYPRLLTTPEASLVSTKTVELGRFLKVQLQAGRLRTEFEPVEQRLVYHTPCHLAALGTDRPMLELLQLIPSLTVRPLELGCSGMAGSFGLSREHYLDSVRIGRRLIRYTRTMPEDGGVTECSGCKMQMEQGTEQPTLHPIKVLARSYGLMPRLEKAFARHRGRLTVS